MFEDDPHFVFPIVMQSNARLLTILPFRGYCAIDIRLVAGHPVSYNMSGVGSDVLT